MRNIIERGDTWYVKGNGYLMALPSLSLSYAPFPNDVVYAHPDANDAEYEALPFINRDTSQGTYFKLPNGLSWYILTGDRIEPPSVAVLDIETTGLVPEKDRILMVGLDFEDETIILDGAEEDIIPLTFMLLETESPDIIAGHNISEFDIPFLKKRYRLLQNMGVQLPEPPIETVHKKFRVGMEVNDIDVHYVGLSLCADTRLLLMRYDNMTGLKLRSLSLKYTVSAMGLSDRKYETFMEQETEEERKRYLIDDLKDTRKLFYTVNNWWFLLSSLIPVTLEDIYTGTGTLIDYILQKYMLPVYPLPKRRNETKPYEGAKVEIGFTGYIRNVYSLDVVSMYPSIMRKYIRPYWDKYGLFGLLVGAFMDLRVSLKKEGNPMHKALKIVINSFYGYLASAFPFADTKEAKRITALGRKLITDLSERVGRFATVCELDTDGIYFSCDETKEAEIASIIGEYEKQGFGLELTKYDAGLFVKKKNYALWKDGTIIFRGNSLQSRRDDDVIFALVNDIVNAYTTNNPSEAIKQAWRKCIDEYIYYTLQNRTGEWKRLHYLPVVKDENPSNNTKLERLLRLQKVFGRFDTLPECREIALKSKKTVIGELFGQQTLFGGD